MSASERRRLTPTQRRGRYGRPWQRTRLAVLERDGYRCQIQLVGCTILATTVDHIVALADGGAPLDMGNLRAACRRCNSRRQPGSNPTCREW